MVVLATGHQIRCIPWVQVAILTKDIVFICIALFALNIFCEEYLQTMMTSSNGNIFRVTGHLCGKFIGPR